MSSSPTNRDIDVRPPHSGRIIREDNRAINLADKIMEARSPFGRQGVYQLTNQLSYGVWRSFSLQNDHEATKSGSASRSVSGGNLTISTGTTSGSVYRYETAEFGTYQSGKGVQAGIGFSLDQAITDDAIFKAGASTGDDGAFFRFKASTVEAVWISGGTEQKAVKQANWNVDTLDGSGDANNPSGINLDAVNQGMKAEIRWTWYSFGPISWSLIMPDPNAPHEMRTLEVHREKPSGVDHFENPDLPPFAEIDNGTTTTDFSVTLGGRTFDVFGEFQPDTRQVASVTRTGQTVGSAAGIVPLVGIKRKSEFPTGTINTVTAFINSRFISTDQKLQGAFYSVAATSDLTNSSFGSFDNVPSGETSLEGDNSSTAVTIADAERVSDLVVFEAGQGNQADESQEKGIRIPIIRDRPTMFMVENLTNNDATVDSSIAATELY